MKKILFVLAFTTVLASVTRAQSANTFNFGAGLHLALPLGDFNTGYSFGIGGELQGEYGFTDNITGVATTGYTSFLGKSLDDGQGGTYKVPAVGLIPILVGARFYPDKMFFIGFQAGYGIFTGSGSNSSAFDYRPSAGVNLEMLQFILSYNGWSKNGGSLSSLGVSAIYKFGASK
jgi:hypothetical protein